MWTTMTEVSATDLNAKLTELTQLGYEIRFVLLASGGAQLAYLDRYTIIAHKK